ncbi:hypothetical protein EMIHUDRAFT_222686 [Emiliania huxleyi CCMP1516]|uniref:Ribonucleotide reductase large subunit C-terminal domain-containing protein n=2 Tax=Emiliania huxleyi TaxID=2903 RepID=A0A0D3KXT3_EMIH1|nr:hypothetical protein EMIHUDRAFT_222686 [Emiliania huxleyi CCMP1516]EOD40568.1 hypothetical protein EMIHUDRAFT_222686 [Emiliania huxleyi CCMP1516]|eukprot:XP_005792997.1 hypothetical protein EMIHUDRAFT_222686 [Emiliania huxleyi CCMP1516]
MLRVFDSAARYVDQGGGKRKGAFAVYLEPWHVDVEDFLELRKNHGKEENRERTSELYEQYEREGKARKTIQAQTLWLKIIESQTETGTPYMLYKDAINKKSNQANVGITTLYRQLSTICKTR